MFNVTLQSDTGVQRHTTEWHICSMARHSRHFCSLSHHRVTLLFTVTPLCDTLAQCQTTEWCCCLVSHHRATLVLNGVFAWHCCHKCTWWIRGSYVGERYIFWCRRSSFMASCNEYSYVVNFSEAFSDRARYSTLEDWLLLSTERDKDMTRRALLFPLSKGARAPGCTMNIISYNDIYKLTSDIHWRACLSFFPCG